MGQICILHFENMLPPFAKLHLVSARATAGACELLQRFVVLFGFNWRSFSRKKLRRFDQVWMKFYILNMSLRADTDGKMRCMCEICIHEYISTKLVISVIFEVSSVLRNFSTLPVSCPGNSGTVDSSVLIMKNMTWDICTKTLTKSSQLYLLQDIQRIMHTTCPWLCLDVVWYKSLYINRDQSKYAPSQWETSLQCNDVSHWLGANLDWSLYIFHISFTGYVTVPKIGD